MSKRGQIHLCKDAAVKIGVYNVYALLLFNVNRNEKKSRTLPLNDLLSLGCDLAGTSASTVMKREIVLCHPLAPTGRGSALSCLISFGLPVAKGRGTLGIEGL